MAGRFTRYAALALVIVGAAIAHPVLISAILLVLVLLAMVNVSFALKAMLLSVLIKMLNPALVTYPANSNALLWLVPVIAGIRILITMRGDDVRKLAPLWAFSAVAALLSVVTSPAVQISLMKLGAFTLVVSGVLMAAGRLTAAESRDMAVWYAAVGATVIAASLVTLVAPGVAYFLNGTGLQGILNHPQSLGGLISPILAFLLARIFLNKQKNLFVFAAVAVLLLGVVTMTQARTAAISALLGLACAGIVRLARGRRSVTQRSTGKVWAGAAFGLVAVVAAVGLSSGLQDYLIGFVLKRDAADIGTAFYASRGAGIENQWFWFLQSPAIGNGFGVYANGEFPDGIVSVMGIPISAPVEKGFLPTAVLEETGVIGALFFVVLLVALARRVLRGQDLAWVAVFFATLFINLGEAMLFSAGGMGLFCWLVLALAIAQSNGVKRYRVRRAQPATVVTGLRATGRSG